MFVSKQKIKNVLVKAKQKKKLLAIVVVVLLLVLASTSVFLRKTEEASCSQIYEEANKRLNTYKEDKELDKIYKLLSKEQARCTNNADDWKLSVQYRYLLMASTFLKNDIQQSKYIAEDSKEWVSKNVPGGAETTSISSELSAFNNLSEGYAPLDITNMERNFD